MTRRTDPSAATVRLVRDRDQWLCVNCGSPRDLTTQHRAGRGMGGTRSPQTNLPANLLTLCGSGTTGCHGWVEHHPREATELGLAVSRWADPATQPVATWRGWLLLHNDGTETPYEPRETETPWMKPSAEPVAGC